MLSPYSIDQTTSPLDLAQPKLGVNEQGTAPKNLAKRVEALRRSKEGAHIEPGSQSVPYPPPLTLADIISQPPPEIKWIVPRLIPQGCIGLIQGLPSAGKSFFALYLGLCIANGGSIGGLRPTRGVTVKYISLEDDETILHCRAAKLCETIKSRATTGYQLYPWRGIPILIRKGSDVTLSPQAKSLVDDIKETKKPSLIIIDHWSGALKGFRDENSSSEQEDALRLLDEICVDTGCTIALIHHTSKGSSERVPLYASRGSSVLPARARFILSVQQPSNEIRAELKEKANGTFIELDTVKLSYAKQPPKMYYRISDEGYFYPVEIDIKSRDVKIIADAVIKCITQNKPELKLTDLLTNSKFKAALKAISISPRERDKIRSLLDEAVKQKFIKKHIKQPSAQGGRKAEVYSLCDG